MSPLNELVTRFLLAHMEVPFEHLVSQNTWDLSDLLRHRSKLLLVTLLVNKD